jgi:hypothetical protein
MAAGLGFKNFITGDVLTAADVNGYLMQGVLVFASSAARASAITSPQEGQYSFLKDTNATEYYDGAAWVATGGGGGGKVLQVVSTLKTDTFSAASNSLVDITGYSVSITPTSATSKILVLVNLNGNGTPASNGAVFALLRGATDIAAPSSPGSRDAGFGNIYINDAAQMGSTSITVLDAPATTSALTYKVQGQNTGTSGGSFYINRTSQDANDNNHSRTTSSITVMEIGA